jgi:hypothetical protein
MTSAPTTRSAPQSAPSDSQKPRLRLKPRGPVTGFVDGAWWPRSRDLPAELPALLAVLAVRLGPVESVSYNLDDWGPTPRKITLDGRIVRLAGYRSQHPATIDVLAANHRITLLVVPPEATPEVAHGALMAAGRRANADRVEALLLAGDADDADDLAQLQWDLDGGPVRMRSIGSRPVRIPDA